MNIHNDFQFFLVSVKTILRNMNNLVLSDSEDFGNCLHGKITYRKYVV